MPLKTDSVAYWRLIFDLATKVMGVHCCQCRGSGVYGVTTRYHLLADYEIEGWRALGWDVQVVEQPPTWVSGDGHLHLQQDHVAIDLSWFNMHYRDRPRVLHSRIEDLGVQHEYATALIDASGSSIFSNHPDIIWACLQASEEQRMRAAYQAVTGTVWTCPEEAEGMQ